MYRSLLLPTDGSERARAAAEAGLRLAQALGARVALLHVTPTFVATGISAHAILRESQSEAEHARAEARKVLDPIARTAAGAGVACLAEHRIGDRPWEIILAVAAENASDLIVMAGCQRSARVLLLGSQATKVLSHARIPVLIWRERA